MSAAYPVSLQFKKQLFSEANSIFQMRTLISIWMTGSDLLPSSITAIRAINTRSTPLRFHPKKLWHKTNVQRSKSQAPFHLRRGISNSHSGRRPSATYRTNVQSPMRLQRKAPVFLVSYCTLLWTVLNECFICRVVDRPHCGRNHHSDSDYRQCYFVLHSQAKEPTVNRYDSRTAIR
jgi:hypothetical protein